MNFEVQKHGGSLLCHMSICKVLPYPVVVLILSLISYSYTIFAAEACFLDQYVGSLSPGKLADFVVLSANSWDEFAAGGSAAVEATYVGGIRAFP